MTEENQTQNDEAVSGGPETEPVTETQNDEAVSGGPETEPVTETETQTEEVQDDPGTQTTAPPTEPTEAPSPETAPDAD